MLFNDAGMDQESCGNENKTENAGDDHQAEPGIKRRILSDRPFRIGNNVERLVDNDQNDMYQNRQSYKGSQWHKFAVTSLS
jgi:hypothetical protein